MHTRNTRHLRLAGLVVACVAVAFQGGFAVDSALRLVDVESQVLRPWTLNRFGRVIGVTNPLVDTAGLHVGDRIVAINGRPLVNRVVQSATFASVKPGELLAVTVEHSTGEQVPVETIVLFPSGSSGEFTPTSKETVWLTAVGWPMVCVGLAAYLLLTSPVKAMSWLLAGVLVLFAQAGRMSFADPLLWPEPWRSGSVIYQNLASWPGVLWLILLILFFPGRLWPPAALRVGVAVVTPIVAVLTVIQLIGSFGEVFSYEAVQWLEPYGRMIHFFSMNFLLYTLTALVLTTAFCGTRPLYSFRQILAFRYLRTFVVVAFVPIALRVTLLFDYAQPDYASWSSWFGTALFAPVLVLPIGLVWLHQAKRIVPARLAVRECCLSCFGRDGSRLIDRLFASETRRAAELLSWRSAISRMRSQDIFGELTQVIREAVDMELYVVHWRRDDSFRVVYLAEGVTLGEGEQDATIRVDDPQLAAHREEVRTGDWDVDPVSRDDGVDLTAGAPADATVAHPIGCDGQLVGFLTLTLKTDGSVFNAIDSERLNAIGDGLAARLESKPPWKSIVPEA